MMSEEEKIKRVRRMLLMEESDSSQDQLIKDALDEADYASIQIATKIVKRALFPFAKGSLVD